MVHWKYTLVLAYLMITRPVFSSSSSYDDEDEENDDEEEDEDENENDEDEDDEDDYEDSDYGSDEDHEYSDYHIKPHRTTITSSETGQQHIPHRIYTSQAKHHLDRYKYMLSTDSLKDRSTDNEGPKKVQRTSSDIKKPHAFKEQQNHMRVEDNEYDVQEQPLLYPRKRNKTSLVDYTTKAQIDIYKEGVKIPNYNYVPRRSSKKSKLKVKHKGFTSNTINAKYLKTLSASRHRHKDNRRHFTDDQITQNKMHESPTKTTLAMTNPQEVGMENTEHVPSKRPIGRTTIMYRTSNVIKDKRNDVPTRVGIDPTVIYYEEFPLSEIADTTIPSRTTVIAKNVAPEPSSTIGISFDEENKDSNPFSEDKTISQSNELSSGKSESNIPKIKQKQDFESPNKRRQSHKNVEKSSTLRWEEVDETAIARERELEDEDLAKPVMKSSPKPTMKKYNILEDLTESAPSSTWKHYTRTTTLAGPTLTSIASTDAPEASLECYSCEHTPSTPSKMCLDPETFNDPHSRDITMICDHGEKCYTAALFRDNELYTVLRGCRSHCFRTDDYICCDERLCNKDAFDLPLSLRAAITASPNRTTTIISTTEHEIIEISGSDVDTEQLVVRGMASLATVSLGLLSMGFASALALSFAKPLNG